MTLQWIEEALITRANTLRFLRRREQKRAEDQLKQREAARAANIKFKPRFERGINENDVPEELRDFLYLRTQDAILQDTVSLFFARAAHSGSLRVLTRTITPEDVKVWTQSEWRLLKFRVNEVLQSQVVRLFIEELKAVGAPLQDCLAYQLGVSTKGDPETRGQPALIPSATHCDGETKAKGTQILLYSFNELLQGLSEAHDALRWIAIPFEFALTAVSWRRCFLFDGQALLNNQAITNELPGLVYKRICEPLPDDFLLTTFAPRGSRGERERSLCLTFHRTLIGVRDTEFVPRPIGKLVHGLKELFGEAASIPACITEAGTRHVGNMQRVTAFSTLQELGASQEILVQIHKPVYMREYARRSKASAEQEWKGIENEIKFTHKKPYGYGCKKLVDNLACPFTVDPDAEPDRYGRKPRKLRPLLECKQDCAKKLGVPLRDIEDVYGPTQIATKLITKRRLEREEEAKAAQARSEAASTNGVAPMTF